MSQFTDLVEAELKAARTKSDVELLFKTVPQRTDWDNLKLLTRVDCSVDCSGREVFGLSGYDLTGDYYLVWHRVPSFSGILSRQLLLLAIRRVLELAVQNLPQNLAPTA